MVLLSTLPGPLPFNLNNCTAPVDIIPNESLLVAIQ